MVKPTTESAINIQHSLLDAALVLALVAFVATVAFARFVEYRAAPEEVTP